MSSISLKQHRYKRSCGHKEPSDEKGQGSATLVWGWGIPGGDSILEEPQWWRLDKVYLGEDGGGGILVELSHEYKCSSWLEIEWGGD